MAPTLAAAAATAASMLQTRQYVDEDGRTVHWWYSETGRIVKWSVFFGIVCLILLFMLGGYFHARSRLKKGLPPLRYHRWMVRRQYRGGPQQHGYSQHPHYYQHQQQQQGYATYRPSDAYDMQNMGVPPPPVYDPNSARPPMYVPPEGGSKVDPVQGGSSSGMGAQHRPDSFAPPPGPPPPPQQGGVASHGTGNTNPFR